MEITSVDIWTVLVPIIRGRVHSPEYSADWEENPRDRVPLHLIRLNSDFVGSWTREDDLIVEPIPFVDGYVPTPMAPGLGCDLDAAALERYGRAHETLRK